MWQITYWNLGRQDTQEKNKVQLCKKNLHHGRKGRREQQILWTPESLIL